MKTNKQILMSDNLFLTDRALVNAKNDAFDHLSYAIILENIIRKQPTPFNIGIFGKWGVGKSTILNLLKERFENDIKKKKTKFIDVKVWKYDEKSLRSKFIINIAEGLDIPIDDIYQEIYHDKEFETAILNFKDIIKTIFSKTSIALWLLIPSLVFLIIVKIINFIEIDSFLWKPIFIKIEEFIGIPLFISLLYWIYQIYNKAKFKLKIGKYDSEEQFERKFIELIKDNKSKKIIFIDDLDRCSKEKVITTLETIKTFLDVENCIFIIACDDEIIKEAINRANEIYESRNQDEGAEYLEKFFQYTITIPPFMIPDMRQFVKNMLEREKNDLKSFEENLLDDIIFIMINSNVKNPRNAIVVMNEFSSAYLLAQHREKNTKSRMHEKLITSNLRILAITRSLKIHFSRFYQDLFNNNYLLFYMIEIVNGNKKFSENEIKVLKKYFKKVPINDTNDESELEIDWKNPIDNETARLINFIESTKDFVTVNDITPFLYLEIDNTSYLVGNEYLQDLNQSLKNGVESKVEEILNSEDKDKLEYLFEQIIFWIDEKLDGTERRKALQVLLKNLGKCPEKKLFAACTTFFRRFNNLEIDYDDYKNYDINGLFKCANILSGNRRNKLINKIITLLQGSDEKFELHILESIFNNHDLLNQKHINNVKKYIDRVSLSKDEQESEETQDEPKADLEYIINKIEEYGEDAEVIKKFFSGKVVDDLVDYLVEIEGADESIVESTYNETIKVFEIIKEFVLDVDINRKYKIYSKLLITSHYYKIVLEDLNKTKHIVPNDLTNILTKNILEEIRILTDPEKIEISFDLIDFWQKEYENIDEDNISKLSTQIIEISQKDDTDIFELSIVYFNRFSSLFNEDQLEEIFNIYLSLIDSENVNNNSIKDLFINNKDILTESVKNKILNIVSDEFHILNKIRNDGYYEFWSSFIESISDLYNDEDFDVLIKPNDQQNILFLGFPGATLEDRTRYCVLIRNNFEKISSSKQNEYFTLFINYFQTNTKENIEYSIKNIHPVYDNFKEPNFVSNHISLFTNLIDLIEPEYQIQLIEILYSNRENMQDELINKCVEILPKCCSFNPSLSFDILEKHWDDFETTKIILIKALLKTQIFESNENRGKIFALLENDLDDLEEEQIENYLDDMGLVLKDNDKEWTFFSDYLEIASKVINSEIRKNIIDKKVDEIDKGKDIDLCRNKFSLIIKFKQKEHEKDDIVNNLFFRLLNNNVQKKKLALDNFEYYYENKVPYRRKVELTEKLNNLLNDMDSDYKKRIYLIGEKYNLKLRKRFWGLFNNFIY